MNGYKNEFDFINYLNKKTYRETNILFQELLKEIFPTIKNNDLIKAYKYGRYAKVDIVIEVDGIKKGISIKQGSRNSVHIESITMFKTCLEKLRFIYTDKLLRYLYSDGTNDNTGIIRQSSSEYKENNNQDIVLINNSLELIKKDLIIRFLIKTDIDYKVTVDAFIQGQVHNFLWATKEEVIDYLTNVNEVSLGVHVSNLFIQNWNKNIKKNPKYEHCRNYIQVKWYNMFDDLIRIMCKRSNN